jgi:cytoskeletal protein CcmA (bactofilin family)
MFKLKLTKNVPIDTLVSVKTRINGDVEFCGGLHVDGYIKGNVSGGPGGGTTLVVGEQGRIEGSVSVSNMVLNGIVNGDIEATDRVELGEKARVSGNVQYNVIESAVGAQINGKLIHRAIPADLASGAAGGLPGSGESDAGPR